MIQQFIKFYELIEEKKAQLKADSIFIDEYRGQPVTPDQFDFFPTPAIFVDYKIVGQGKNQPRLITIILHNLCNEDPNTSNASNQQDFDNMLFNLVLQQILEGTRLGNSSELKFISEEPAQEAVVDYHIQMYQCEVYLKDMTAEQDAVTGMIEKIKLKKTLKIKK